MILLYANPLEVKHIYYEPKTYIGLRCSHLNKNAEKIKKHEFVVLFGSCGLIDNVELDEFIVPNEWWRFESYPVKANGSLHNIKCHCWGHINSSRSIS